MSWCLSTCLAPLIALNTHALSLFLVSWDGISVFLVYPASAEKKKKEKEGKFLVAAELALNEIVSSAFVTPRWTEYMPAYGLLLFWRAYLFFTWQISSRSEEFQDGVAEMFVSLLLFNTSYQVQMRTQTSYRDSIYADFQLAYAAADDEIRKLWVALMEELQSFQVCPPLRQKMLLVKCFCGNM